MSRRLPLFAAALLGTTALLWSLPQVALAQDAAATADAPEASADEEVTVTATRRSTRVIDVPYNITAISGAKIEDQKILDAPELMRGVPGVNYVDRGARNAAVVDGIRIRGVNTDSAALGDYAVSAVSAVATYVDETPLFANFLLRDIERVEVLLGPQGTLYGSGALGGTVRYLSRKPQLGETSVSASATMSNVNGSGGIGWAGDLTVNVPIGEKLALRVTGSILDYPGVTDYVNLYVLDSTGAPAAPLGVLNPAASYTSKKDADFLKTHFIRASLLWEPVDWFDATLKFAYQKDEYGGRRGNTLGSDGFGRPYQRFENGSIQLEPGQRDVNWTALEMNVDLGFATLTSSSSYYEHEGDSTSENTGFYARAGFLSFYYNYPRPMASAVRAYSDEAFIQELRLVSKPGETIDYIVGGYYQQQSRFASQDSYLRGFKRWWDLFAPAAASAVSGDQDFLYRRDENFTERALYGELTWHVTDKFHITGGLRYFSNDSDNTTLIDIPLYTALSNPTNAYFESSDTGTLFKLNASWNFAENNLLYATISEGFRRGGSNAVPLSGFFAEDPRWQVYEPDRVTNYEVGVKGRTGGITYTASLFYVDWTDAQLNTATPNWGFFVVQNAGDVRVYGLELGLSGSLGDAFNYSVGYAYNNAELTEDFFSPINMVTPIANKGDRIPGVPEHSFSIAGDYTWQVGNGLSLIARADGYYQSETENAISRSTLFRRTLPGFQIWNASATLAGENWDMTFFVKNIFDADGVTGIYTEQYMGTSPANGYFGNGSKELTALSRTLGLSVSYRY
ncbi:MAG: TonB-dependent receptor [Micropepsaceae bacterium]